MFLASEASAHSWSSDWGRRAARKFKWRDRLDESSWKQVLKIGQIIGKGNEHLWVRCLPGSKPKWRREASRGPQARGYRAWGTIGRRRSWGSAAWSPGSPPDPPDPLVESGRCRSTPPADSSYPSPSTHPFHASDSFVLSMFPGMSFLRREFFLISILLEHSSLLPFRKLPFSFLSSPLPSLYSAWYNL